MGAGEGAGLHPIDWAIVLAYVVVALTLGALFARRAGRSLDEYFLSGRSLPWWVAGTSMVATSFAADTPLLITGWVRDHGIWKNWAWWCFAITGTLHVFLFARWWRRAGVMTKAELAELRYGERGAALLRGTLGILHGAFTNTMVLCWVMLAAAKILDVLFGVDVTTGLLIASSIALTYSLLAGFWGVVLTDLVQFVMAMLGAFFLAWAAWRGLGGSEGLAAALAEGTIASSTVAFFPPAGPGSPLDASFWTVPIAAIAVYLGLSWWAVESVDGSGAAVQRIAAAKDERAGMLSMLWFQIAHYALRPWLWITVALASLPLLPHVVVRAPVEGTVVAAGSDALRLAPTDGSETLTLALEESSPGWRPSPLVDVGALVVPDQTVARTDSERAYVAMMLRFLPVGWLGLVAASLLAAFMSTIDTHVNLASSFLVNDVYRRFVRRDATAAHYVRVARLASVGVLGLAGAMAARADSIADLFLFFLAFLGGVGPVYVLRWLWWRVTPAVEIAAMLASATTTTLVTQLELGWPATALSPGGALSVEGRLCLVVAVSALAAGVTLLARPAPDPARLVTFYRRVRPLGWWGPVRALCPDVRPPRELGRALLGAASALAATYGAMLCIGFVLVDRPAAAGAAAAIAIAGGLGTKRAIGGM